MTYDLLTMESSPTSIKGLKTAGIEDADLFIAVTPNESANLSACAMAHQLGAKKTVARVDNPEYVDPSNQELFKKMGVSSIIYPEMLAAKDIINGLRCHGYVNVGMFMMVLWSCWESNYVKHAKYSTVL